jgi:hypothetical protein
MSGIRLKNLHPASLLGRQFHYGTDVWCPPGDPQHICLFQALASNTANGNLTLNPDFVARGQVLPWPQQISIVLENNRTSPTGKPGAVQATPNISGSTNALPITVSGFLNGSPQVETLTINIGTLLQPNGIQLSHVRTSRFYDRITSISHGTKTGTWGTLNALQIGVGTGIALLGEAPLQASRMLAPMRPNLPSQVRALFFPDTGEAAVQGTTQASFQFDNAAGWMAIPGRARNFDVSLGACAVTSTTADRSVALTAHGLRKGDVVRVRPLDNGLPTGLSLNTNYYVQPGVDANSFRLAADATARTATATASTDRVGLTNHGIAAGTPLLLQPANVGSVLQALPTVSGTALSTSAIYFALAVDANNIQIERTVGGGAVDFTADSTGMGVVVLAALGTGGNFVSGEAIEVLRPRASWERARLIYEDGENAERM